VYTIIYLFKIVSINVDLFLFFLADLLCTESLHSMSEVKENTIFLRKPLHAACGEIGQFSSANGIS
jgi:hypothetical protein